MTERHHHSDPDETDFKNWFDEGEYKTLGTAIRYYDPKVHGEDMKNVKDYEYELCVRGPYHWIHGGCQTMPLDDWRKHAERNYLPGYDNAWKVKPMKKILDRFERLLIAHYKAEAKAGRVLPGLSASLGVTLKPKQKAAKRKAKA